MTTAAAPEDAASAVAARSDTIDWPAMETERDAEGHALIPDLLTPADCQALAALHDAA